jgi:hypothetical protein
MPLLNAASAIYVGESLIDAAYMGAVQAWSPATPPGSFTSLDPARTGSGITLSNNNLTASGTGANISVALVPKSAATANYYWEAAVDVLPSYVAVGVFPDTGTFDGEFLGQSDGGGAWSDGSTNYGSAYQSGSMFGYGEGDVLQLWLYLGLLYIGRVGDGWWRGDTNVFEPTPHLGGGHVFDVPDATSVSPAMSFFDGSTDSITFNFGASAFAGSVPSGGVGGWPDS